VRRNAGLAALLGPAVAIVACGAPGPRPVVIELPGAPAAELQRAEPSPAASRPPSKAGPIAWVASEPDAVARSRKAGLPLLVWVRADWDAATLEMERRVWVDPAVAEAARPFVALKLDVTEVEGDAERLAERYDVAAIPCLVLVDPRGHRTAKLGGFQDAAKVAAALRAAAEE
jgi:thiol:disulfide interchange protein